MKEIYLEKEKEIDPESKERTITYNNGKNIKKKYLESISPCCKRALIIVGIVIGIIIIGIIVFVSLFTNRCKIWENSCKNTLL